MIPIEEISVGDRVHYQPEHFTEDKYENGIVKEKRHNAVWVVYHCDGNWDNFKEYTGALTRIDDLHKGWKKL